ncbi:MAG TPA: AAA family ATPase, partial [Clostridiales bacterium]|nr:AAA family ATPase [Clostridiales bacterium]
MKIESCHIAGFGALKGQNFSFRDGLNTLCLPNGAGKSTLAGFIKCMLYGLSDTKKQNIAENERKRFAPIGGGAFGGSMTFSSALGRFTIERTFGKKASDDTFALYDASTGKRSSCYKDPVG